MLDSHGIRQLCYVVSVGDVTPIEGADRIEAVHINGWTCVCGKGEFHKGDKAVYFEIDSEVPQVKPFTDMEFLAKKHYKIKMQKIRGVYSAGLLLPFSAFGWENDKHQVGDFVTEELGVFYNVPEDNVRKADTNSGDKYKRMAARNPEVFKKKPVRWLYKREWGKKLLYVFYGKKNMPLAYPSWVKRTDEERCQCIPDIFTSSIDNRKNYLTTEKIDGTSSTYTLRVYKRNIYDYYICSRNRVMSYYRIKFKDTDIAPKILKEWHVGDKDDPYTQMNDKYDLMVVLLNIFVGSSMDYITLQGETYGKKIQKNSYDLEGRDFAGFNFIDSKNGRWGSVKAKKLFEKYKVPWVPILDENFTLPDSVDAMLEYADGDSVINGKPREGVVVRSLDGQKSFKAVSNKYLTMKGMK